MTGVRPRFLRSAPYLSAFPELNVRTYVVANGRPGVWFFSLDAANVAAVKIARWTYHLSYYHARMSCTERDGWILYKSRRLRPAQPEARFDGRYRSLGEVYTTEAGSLERWWTERYSLYAADRRDDVFRADVDHCPWPLQRAEAGIEANTMVEAMGLRLPADAPALHFSCRVDVIAGRVIREPAGRSRDSRRHSRR